jgi:antirestriction protein ArdC
MASTTRKTRKSGTRKSTGPKRDIFQEVTDRMVAALEAGTVPWRKPWNTRKNGHLQNLVSGRAYRGVNIWLLSLAAMEHGFTSPYWLTKNQIIAQGGSWSGPGTLITLWKTFVITEPDETGKMVKKTIPMLRHYYVWNLEQTTDVKLPKRVVEAQSDEPVFEHTPIESAEAVVAAYIENGPELRHGGDRAFYRTDADVITVPERTSFANLDEYYSTLFHEVGHSTGNANRLARKFGATFGDHDYGREELIAEMTSAYLQAETGIETAEANSAAYLQSWIKTIKEDIRAVVVAAGAAQKAADLVLGRPAFGEAAEATEQAPEAVEGQQERHAA